MPTIRKASPDDFDYVYPLFGGFHEPRPSKEEFRQLFVPRWGSDESHVGFILEENGEAVGYLGTLFSMREINGRMEKFWSVLRCLGRLLRPDFTQRLPQRLHLRFRRSSPCDVVLAGNGEPDDKSRSRLRVEQRSWCDMVEPFWKAHRQTWRKPCDSEIAWRASRGNSNEPRLDQRNDAGG